MHQRIDDAPINRYFGFLVEEGERLIVNFDPPSKTVNAAKLERNLRSCDGMGGHQGARWTFEPATVAPTGTPLSIIA